MDHAADAQRTDLMTITRFVLNEQSKFPEARGDLTILLNHIVLGCKFVCSSVSKAGLAKLIGLAGETNVQGEEQKKLDVLSNDVFIKALVSSGRTNVLVSEELEEAVFVEESLRGRYCVVFDPLDGSSNIDCGVSIGTIFGIYMLKEGSAGTLHDVLQPGKNMIAAGYCMYGSSCTLVLSTGTGVNGFTLDPSLGEFILTHPHIKIPRKGKIYSVNEGNAKNWDEPTRKFVDDCKFPKDGSSPKSLRYIGSMVADVHRTLLYGGIFMYPADKKSPSGKLRVLYEVFPMSFLVEQAGGVATTGKERALDIVPTKIHERSPIFLGSFDDVEQIKAFSAIHKRKRNKENQAKVFDYEPIQGSDEDPFLKRRPNQVGGDMLDRGYLMQMGHPAIQHHNGPREHPAKRLKLQHAQYGDDVYTPAFADRPSLPVFADRASLPVFAGGPPLPDKSLRLSSQVDLGLLMREDHLLHHSQRRLQMGEPRSYMPPISTIDMYERRHMLGDRAAEVAYAGARGFLPSQIPMTGISLHAENLRRPNQITYANTAPLYGYGGRFRDHM